MAGVQGSPAYWTSARYKLHDMIDQLGQPHLFFTLSAADSYWPELDRLICQLEGVDPATLANESPAESLARRRIQLAKYPVLADTYMHERASTYIQTVIRAFFGVRDAFIRTEYQHRGSCHFHCLFWITFSAEDAPDWADIGGTIANEAKTLFGPRTEPLSFDRSRLQALRATLTDAGKAAAADKLYRIIEIIDKLCCCTSPFTDPAAFRAHFPDPVRDAADPPPPAAAGPAPPYGQLPRVAADEAPCLWSFRPDRDDNTLANDLTALAAYCQVCYRVYFYFLPSIQP